MKAKLFKAYGEVSPRFHDRVERTLEDIMSKEELPVKRYAYKTACIAVAALLALTGAALALGNALGLLDFFSVKNGLTPGEGAQESITTEICSAEAGQMRYTLREAVYDGASVRALIEVEPLEPEKYIASYVGASDIGGANDLTDEELAERSGRKLIKTGYPNLDYGKDTEEYMRLELGAEYASAYRDGDKLLIYTETTVANVDGGDTPDELILRYYMIADDFSDYASLPFTLKKCALSSAEYAPSAADIPNITLTGVSILQTPFADYMHVSYVYKVHIELLDYQPDTVYYGTPAGISVHTDPNCMGMANAKIMTVEEARATRKQLCGVCAGGASARPDGEKWTFIREDAQGKLFASTYDIDRASVDMDIYTYTQTRIYRQGEALPDALTLSALYDNEPAGITIQCERLKQ